VCISFPHQHEGMPPGDKNCSTTGIRHRQYEGAKSYWCNAPLRLLFEVKRRLQAPRDYVPVFISAAKKRHDPTYTDALARGVKAPDVDPYYFRNLSQIAHPTSSTCAPPPTRLFGHSNRPHAAASMIAWTTFYLHCLDHVLSSRCSCSPTPEPHIPVATHSRYSSIGSTDAIGRQTSELMVAGWGGLSRAVTVRKIL
jgi:hypothetical protein